MTLTIDPEAETLKEGDIIKVHLPGEWPFAIVTAVHHKDVVQARLDNQPADESSPYRLGDVLTFQYRGCPQMPDYPAWEVSPGWEQLPIGPQPITEGPPPAAGLTEKGEHG